MSVVAHSVDEDILTPLLARLTTIWRLLTARTSLPHDDDTQSKARDLLVKIQRGMEHLQDKFRCIDDQERRMRDCFNPVEQLIDDALQYKPANSVEQLTDDALQDKPANHVEQLTDDALQDKPANHVEQLTDDALQDKPANPVKQLTDDALQKKPANSIEHIYENLRKVDEKLKIITKQISQWYVLSKETTTVGPQPTASPPASSHRMVITKRMVEIRHSPQMHHLKLAVGGLDERLRGCALCLVAFPSGAVIKKRLLIHWWIGEGFVNSANEGETRFEELLSKGFLIPIRGGLCRTIHRCTARPWMHDVLADIARDTAFLELDQAGNDDNFALARRVCLLQWKPTSGLSPDVRTIYNIDNKYVHLDKDWFSGKKELRTVQLGQWRQFSPGEQIEKPMESHIEISGGEENFAYLESCKNLRYLSLRGTSRIQSLHDSIGKLSELVVLDLRGCCNLEELSEGITKLYKLEYLDVSDCYVLAGMPGGLGQLTRLEVLKGFVVAKPCHLHELTKLEKLRKLSISIGKMAPPEKDELLELGELKTVRSLTITWGVGASAKEEDTRFAVGPDLEKLDLRCFPLTNLPRVARLDGVKKLYIRGGKLTTLGDGGEWKAEVLRLRFLENLKCDDKFEASFEKFKDKPNCIEICGCPKLKSPWLKSIIDSK